MKKGMFFLAIVAILSVNKSIAQVTYYIRNSTGYNIDMYPEEIGVKQIAITGDDDETTYWTSGLHSVIKSIVLTIPGGDTYVRSVGPITTPFFVRIIQDVSTIVVTDNGDGTMTISGIDPYFAGGDTIA